MLPSRRLSRATIKLTAVSLTVGQFAAAFMAPAYAQESSSRSWLLTPVDSVFKSHQFGSTTGGAGSYAPSTPSVSGSTDEDNLTVEDVTIEGNRLVPSEEILGVVKTHRGDRFDRDQVLQDLKAVNGMGYFDDRSLQAIPEMGGGGVLLKIRVQENAPVTGFAFQGNTVLSSEDLAKLFSNQLGKPQNLTQLSQAIDKVEQAYHEKGFMLARVVDVKDDPDGSVGIKVDEGTISDIKIVGNKKTKDFIIRRAIKLKPGAVYNERELTADLRRLYGNGYFQDIRRSLTPDPTNPEKYTLKVEVDEKRTGSVGLGGGLDTMSGPFGSFSFGDSNFRGRGEAIQVSTQVGTAMFNGVTNSLNNGGQSFLPSGNNSRVFQVEANYAIPNIRGTNNSLGVNAFGRNFASMMVDSSMQRSIGTGVTLSRPLGNNNTLSMSLNGEQTVLKGVEDMAAGGIVDTLAQRAAQLGYANVDSAIPFAQRLRQQQLRGGLYATFAPTITHDTRDSVFDPHKGVMAKITGGPSIGITGPSFMKLGASFSTYKQLGEKTTLAMGTSFGAGIGGMPAFSQFRLGGFNGIRGYRQFSDLGNGSTMLMGSMELRRKLPLPKGDKNSAGGHMLAYIDKNVRWTGFMDYGAVGGNSLMNTMYSRNAWGASVGLGLRINVPMLGIVRLDYGFPLVSTAMGHFIPRFTLGFGDKF